MIEVDLTTHKNDKDTQEKNVKKPCVSKRDFLNVKAAVERRAVKSIEIVLQKSDGGFYFGRLVD